MSYNWAKVVRETKLIMANTVSFIGTNASHTEALFADFKCTLFHTDNFHPFDYDSELSLCSELDNMPAGKCNYRNIESYWDHKQFRKDLEYALNDWFSDIFELIQVHYEDEWNFAPGYVKPKAVVFSKTPDQLAAKTVARILRAAKRPVDQTY